jgi:hypothetical protein
MTCTSTRSQPADLLFGKNYACLSLPLLLSMDSVCQIWKEVVRSSAAKLEKKSCIFSAAQVWKEFKYELLSVLPIALSLLKIVSSIWCHAETCFSVCCYGKKSVHSRDRQGHRTFNLLVFFSLPVMEGPV